MGAPKESFENKATVKTPSVKRTLKNFNGKYHKLFKKRIPHHKGIRFYLYTIFNNRDG